MALTVRGKGTETALENYMSTRITYENQLQDLGDLVVTMASMVDKAISRSIDAMRLQNVELARAIRKADKEINSLQRQGEGMVIMIIATQGPMAGDLRRIASTMSILTNLERMGDYAAGIAKIVIETADEDLLKPLVDIPRMSVIARDMLEQSITAFMQQDVEAARKIAIRDDDVDDLYDQIFRELLTYMMADPTVINRATHLLWAAHNIERIADRVTNICEQVVYTVTGEYEELDGGRKKRQRFARDGSSDKGASG
jgi:phosphate transport system protein